MLKIRLQRVGRKHAPNFRVVLTDSENSTKSGRYKEILGSYDPRTSNDQLNADRLKYWLSQGAEATGTVHNLLVTHKIIEAKKMNVLPRKHPIVKEAPAVESAVEASTPAQAETTEAAPVVEEPVAEPQAPEEVSTEASTAPVVE